MRKHQLLVLLDDSLPLAWELLAGVVGFLREVDAFVAGQFESGHVGHVFFGVGGRLGRDVDAEGEFESPA